MNAETRAAVDHVRLMADELELRAGHTQSTWDRKVWLESAARLRRLVRIVEAGAALSKQLHLIHADSKYQSVWHVFQIHGGDYTDGPKYEAELAALDVALNGEADDAAKE